MVLFRLRKSHTLGYEIVKYEYDLATKTLNFVYKPKTASLPGGVWIINYFDADGVSLSGEVRVVGLWSYDKVGQPERGYASTPSEKDMKRVKKVVITRNVE